MELVIPTPKGIITKPGCYDLSFEEYRGQMATDLCLSPSEAFTINESTPRHLIKQWNDPRIYQKSSDIGTVIHALVLQPEEASDTIVPIDADNWQKKAPRESRDKAISDGLTPLLKKDYDNARRAAEAARSNPQISELLKSYKAETSWFMEVGGKLRLRCRPDLLTSDWIIGDVKTVTAPPSDSFIERRIRAGGWFMSSPMQSTIVETVGNHEVVDFFWIVIEQEQPYSTRLIRPKMATLQIGINRCERAIKEFITCAEENSWPSYNDGITELDMNAGAMMRLEAEVQDEAKKIEQAPINFEGVNF